MYQMNPKSLIDYAKQDTRQMEDFLMDFVNELHKQGHSPSYIQNYLKAIKSWLQFNSITLIRKIKVGNTNRTPTIEDERIPMKNELRQILGYAEARARAKRQLGMYSSIRG
jgi:hypothetical protein